MKNTETDQETHALIQKCFVEDWAFLMLEKGQAINAFRRRFLTDKKTAATYVSAHWAAAKKSASEIMKKQKQMDETSGINRTDEYGIPNMASLPPELGRRIFSQIMAAQKPDTEWLNKECRKLREQIYENEDT